MNIENIVDQKVVINAQTDSEARQVLAILHALNHEWNGGYPIQKYGNIKTYWSENQRNTCYKVLSPKAHSVLFGNKVDYLTNGYKIIEAADFIHDNPLVSKFI